MKTFSRILERLAGIALALSAAGLFLMTLTIGWQVFGRKVLNASPAWSESLALLLMLYFVLLAAAAGVREGFHLRFRLLDNVLPERVAGLLARFVDVLVGAFGALMVVNGLALADFTSTHLIPTLPVSRSVAYWPFVVSGALIVLFSIEHFLRGPSQGPER